MAITERDKRILADLARFRALTRDQLIALYFARNRQAVRTCNFVMARLRDRGYVRVETDRQPFVYLAHDSGIKRGSQKIDHYTAIADVYLAMRQAGKLRRFEVEPKLGEKGTVEPDAFAIWQGWPWYIEVQRSNYSERVMRKKIARYERLKQSGTWRELPWQPTGRKPVWPFVWIIGKRKYDGLPKYVQQTDDVSAMKDIIRKVSNK